MVALRVLLQELIMVKVYFHDQEQTPVDLMSEKARNKKYTDHCSVFCCGDWKILGVGSLTRNPPAN
jgi:hypothetical protein